MDSPQLSDSQVVYQDKNRKIYEIIANFGGFCKEYLVSDSGSRAGVVIVHKQSILLVRQYRLLVDRLSWEIPGGGINEDESAETAAIREVKEESGILCKAINPLLNFQPGMDTNKNPTHIFYSDDWDDYGTAETDPSEVTERSWVPVDRCIDQIFAGEIVDGMTIIAILAYVAKNRRNPVLERSML